MAIAARHAAGLVAALDRDKRKIRILLDGIVPAARRNSLECRIIELPAEELIGINNRADLAAAEALMQMRLRQRAMAAGVTLVAPETVFLSADTRLGRDVVIEPNVFFGPVPLRSAKAHASAPLAISRVPNRRGRGDRRAIRPAAARGCARKGRP